MVILAALSLACHDILQQPDKIWRYHFLFLLIVLQAERAIAHTVFTPSINPTREVIIQPQVCRSGEEKALGSPASCRESTAPERPPAVASTVSRPAKEGVRTVCGSRTVNLIASWRNSGLAH